MFFKKSGRWTTDWPRDILGGAHRFPENLKFLRWPPIFGSLKGLGTTTFGGWTPGCASDFCCSCYEMEGRLWHSHGRSIGLGRFRSGQNPSRGLGRWMIQLKKNSETVEAGCFVFWFQHILTAWGSYMFLSFFSCSALGMGSPNACYFVLTKASTHQPVLLV